MDREESFLGFRISKGKNGQVRVRLAQGGIRITVVFFRHFAR